jgi:hypothetical protein
MLFMKVNTIFIFTHFLKPTSITKYHQIETALTMYNPIIHSIIFAFLIRKYIIAYKNRRFL